MAKHKFEVSSDNYVRGNKGDVVELDLTDQVQALVEAGVLTECKPPKGKTSKEHTE